MSKFKTIFLSVFSFVILQTSFAQTDTLKSGDSSKYERTVSAELILKPTIGAGLIRNVISPTFDIQLTFNYNNKYKFTFSTSSYFFFERDVNRDFTMYRNTFVTLQYMFKLKAKNLIKREENNSNGKNSWSSGIGLGYLIESEGDYFQGTTFKIFYSTKIGRRITFVPELIITDDFKTVFPGVTVKF